MADTLHYRFAEPAEVPEAVRLVMHSFPGASRTSAWWEEQLRSPVYGGGVETLFVGLEADRIVAACQIHRLEQWIGGHAVPVTGVGTVAISPTHRRRRLGAELVTAALDAGLERGDVASSLYPFRASFYRNLGYGWAGSALQYQVSPDDLPDSPERHRVEMLETDATREDALALYNRWAPGQAGQLLRGPRVWDRITTMPDRAVVGYRATTGDLAGYAIVTYRADLPRQNRYLEVEELVWTSPEARRGLYGWLASLGDQWEQLLLRALPSHSLGDWVRNPRLPQGAVPNWGLWAPAATVMLGSMFRLLNLAAAWEARRVVPGGPLTIGLEVADVQFPANGGHWRLAFEEGRILVDRTGNTELTLHLDVSTLSRLFIGSLTPAAAYEAGLLTCDRPDRLPALGAALALPEPWMFDRF